MSSDSKTIACELCVLGTGIAGLNALYAATHYLPKNTRVVVIDKNAAVGGMWQNTYKYVRLHQPHQFFTVGDMKWNLKKDPSYLASRTEIIDHLSDCYSRIKTHFNVIELFSSEFETQNELADGVQVSVRSNGQQIQVNTKQLIKAIGLNVKTNDPFKLSTEKVISCVPENLNLDQNPDKPVYIIGGGKTAMDTALAYIRHNPSRSIHLIAGNGTWFMDREVIAPTGVNRYFKGLTLTKFNMLLAERFSGDNGQACRGLLKQMMGVSLDDNFQGFMLGILSQEENETIRKGLNSVISDYLVDVEDGENGVELRFKNSPPRLVEEGAILVNCSGYIVKGMPDPEPYLSEGKRVLSIQSTSSTLIFSTFDAYFLTHMFFRNKLANSGLYAMNFYAIEKKCKHLVSYAASAQLMHNLLIYIDSLPFSVFSKCHLNLDLWFPKYRQLFSLLQLLSKKKRLMSHCKQALDNFEEKYQIGCKPLVHSTENSGSLVLEGA